MPEPSNWHLYTSEKPIAGNLYDKRVAVALVADDYHFPAHSIVAPFGPNQLLNDWSAKQKGTRITDYNGDWNGYRRTALLSQLVKVTDDHLGEYTAALILGRNHACKEGGRYASGYVYDVRKRPFNGLLDTLLTTNHADKQGAGVDGTPHGILGLRHDAHIEHDNPAYHGRTRFEPTSLDGYREPAGWPYRFKSEMRFDKSVANEHSSNKLETGQWRPFYEAIFFVPETPNDDGGGGGGDDPEGPGVPIPEPGGPGVPVPGGGTGVTLALPLMDPGAPNIPPSDDGFGYIGMATDEDGQIHVYVAQGGDSEWINLCEICCEDCGGATDGPFAFGGDGSDGPVTVVDGASATGMTGTGPYDLQRTLLGGA